MSCFYCGQIRTRDAMVTYSLHRLLNGKNEKLAIYTVSLGLFDFFTEMSIEQSSILQMAIVQIA